MRQWEIQLAEDLEKHKDCQIFCECLELATRAIQSKIDGIDTSTFEISDWNRVIDECCDEIIKEHKK